MKEMSTKAREEDEKKKKVKRETAQNGRRDVKEADEAQWRNIYT